MPTYQTVVSWTYWNLFLVSSPGLRAYPVSSCFKISCPFPTAIYYHLLLHIIPGLLGICSFCYLGVVGVVICKSPWKIVKLLAKPAAPPCPTFELKSSSQSGPALQLPTLSNPYILSNSSRPRRKRKNNEPRGPRSLRRWGSGIADGVKCDSAATYTGALATSSTELCTSQYWVQLDLGPQLPRGSRGHDGTTYGFRCDEYGAMDT